MEMATSPTGAFRTVDLQHVLVSFAELDEGVEIRPNGGFDCSQPDDDPFFEMPSSDRQSPEKTRGTL